MENPAPANEPQAMKRCEQCDAAGPDQQCLCTDCRTETLALEPGVPTEFYIVHDELWAEAGMDRGYLCIGCLETRLGRRLHRGDFTAAEVNDLSCHCPGRPWWWRSNRLRGRLTTPSPHDGTQLPLWGPPARQTLTSPAIQPLFPGQTVRWCSELLRGWYEGRAADGMPYAPAPQIGRITEVLTGTSGFCGLCEHHDRQCPGPWYVVDYGAAGAYGACELELA